MMRAFVSFWDPRAWPGTIAEMYLGIVVKEREFLDWG